MKQRCSLFMYAIVIVIVAVCGGHCKGESEVDEVTALTIHVHRCRHHVWRC